MPPFKWIMTVIFTIFVTIQVLTCLFWPLRLEVSKFHKGYAFFYTLLSGSWCLRVFMAIIPDLNSNHLFSCFIWRKKGLRKIDILSCG
jgi:hypothetical protein